MKKDEKNISPIKRTGQDKEVIMKEITIEFLEVSKKKAVRRIAVLWLLILVFAVAPNIVALFLNGKAWLFNIICIVFAVVVASYVSFRLYPRIPKGLKHHILNKE